MNTLDTNVLVRFFAVFPDDDEQTMTQRRIANYLILQPSFVPITITLELVWVLERVYKFDRQEIFEGLTMLLSFKHFFIENADIVAQACKYYVQGMDFADALHLLKSDNVENFYTFDKRFIKKSTALNTPLKAIHP